MYQIKWVFGCVEKKYRPWLVLGLCLSVLTSCCQFVLPVFSSHLVDDVIIAQNPDPLLGILAAMMGICILQNCLRYLMAMSLEYASQSAVTYLRNFLFDKIQYLDLKFYDKHRSGDLITRLSPDLDWIRHFIAYLTYVTLDNVFMFTSTLVIFFIISWKLTLCLIAVLPVLLIVTEVYSKKVRPKFVESRDRLSDMNTAAQENIAGNRVVKAFAREEYERDRFEVRNREFRDINLDINKTWLSFFPIIEILANVLYIVTIFVGGVFIITGDITAGQLTIFSSLSWTLSNPMRSLGGLINDLQRFGTSATKIMEVYYAKSDIEEKPDAEDHPKMQGKIEFRHVDFGYTEQLKLHDVNFTVEPGKTLAIMGPTGSGKTTIISLLSRFYDVKGGQVLVDDCDVRDWKVQQLRGSIACANQDVFLFSDTVEGNVAFASPEISEEDVHDFTRRAGADHFTRRLPEGYDTIIGERGVGLSGGQKQRLALARAMAARPAILVLDDTTSALDTETEQLIQEELKKLPYTCTKIIIGQRISSVRDADQILIIRNGTIAERGTHEELLRNRKYYYETYCLQQGIPMEEGGVE